MFIATFPLTQSSTDRVYVVQLPGNICKLTGRGYKKENKTKCFGLKSSLASVPSYV